MNFSFVKAQIYRKCTRDSDGRVKQLAIKTQKTTVHKNTQELNLKMCVERLYSFSPSAAHFKALRFVELEKVHLVKLSHIAVVPSLSACPFQLGEGKAADQTQNTAPELDCQS